MSKLKRTYKVTKRSKDGRGSISMDFSDEDKTIKVVEVPYTDLDSFCGAFLANNEYADSYRVDGKFIVFSSSATLAKIELIKEMDKRALEYFGSYELISEEVLPDE